MIINIAHLFFVASGKQSQLKNQLEILSMGATTSSIAAKLAFFPPEPSYKLDTDEQTGKLKLIGVPEGEKGEVSKLQTKKGHSITVVYVRNLSAKLTVLYSHGNAADIGQMFKFLTELCDQLCVNVMGLVLT